MTSSKLFCIALLVLLLSSFTFINPMIWKVAEDYTIQFNSSKASGSFTDFVGVIHFDVDDLPASKFELQIDVASIKTGNFLKNSHAKGKKWFNASAYPTINFTSQEFNKVSEGYEVTGILEMHGVKKEITIPFTFKNNIFESNFIVDRTDFDIGSTKGLAKKVPHEINLDIAVPVSSY